MPEQLAVRTAPSTMATAIAILAVAALFIASAPSAVLAQKAPASTGAEFNCTRLDAKQDPVCAVFPFDSALPPGSSDSHIRSIRAAAAVFQCGTVPASMPLFLCFTPLGNCNGQAWPLPANDTDLHGAVAFYNAVQLGDLTPVATKAGAADKLLCYDDCKASIDWMRGCPAIFAGLDAKHDTCAGLPKGGAACVSAANTPAVSATATTSATATATATVNSSTGAATRRAESGNTLALATVLAAALACAAGLFFV
ncbi:hypothetical protein GGF31_002382 [Allomyces arbusculus]|nr:hypothetical protein GGF31_002382 [Allomyces arbusculus]